MLDDFGILSSTLAVLFVIIRAAMFDGRPWFVRDTVDNIDSGAARLEGRAFDLSGEGSGPRKRALL
jgi:hypothetical protein